MYIGKREFEGIFLRLRKVINIWKKDILDNDF